MPAIDPFIVKNRRFSDAEAEERINKYHIPTVHRCHDRKRAPLEQKPSQVHL